jgi:hypothetical protein
MATLPPQWFWERAKLMRILRASIDAILRVFSLRYVAKARNIHFRIERAFRRKRAKFGAVKPSGSWPGSAFRLLWADGVGSRLRQHGKAKEKTYLGNDSRPRPRWFVANGFTILAAFRLSECSGAFTVKLGVPRMSKSSRTHNQRRLFAPFSTGMPCRTAFRRFASINLGRHEAVRSIFVDALQQNRSGCAI